MTDANNQINDVLSKLTALGTVLIPMNLVTGLWGMNVNVPGQNVENVSSSLLMLCSTTGRLTIQLNWFGGILGCLAAFAVVGAWATVSGSNLTCFTLSWLTLAVQVFCPLDHKFCTSRASNSIYSTCQPFYFSHRRRRSFESCSNGQGLSQEVQPHSQSSAITSVPKKHVTTRGTLPTSESEGKRSDSYYRSHSLGSCLSVGLSVEDPHS